MPFTYSLCMLDEFVESCLILKKCMKFALCSVKKSLQNRPTKYCTLEETLDVLIKYSTMHQTHPSH